MAGKRMASTGAGQRRWGTGPAGRDQVADQPPPAGPSGYGPGLRRGNHGRGPGRRDDGRGTRGRVPRGRQHAVQHAAAAVTNPAARWLAPWDRARATGSKLDDRAGPHGRRRQPRLQRGVPRRGVLHRPVAVHRDRDGHHPDRQEPQAAGRAVERDQLEPCSPRLPPTPAAGWAARSTAGCPAPRPPRAWLRVTPTPRSFARLLGEGWNGHRWTIQPDSKPATGGQPFGISCRWAKDCTAVGQRLTGMTLAEHWNGRTWSAQTTKHLGALDRRVLPGHRELHGRRLEQRRQGARRALEREDVVGPVRGQPAAAQPAGQRVLHRGQGLRGGRPGGHDQPGAFPGARLPSTGPAGAGRFSPRRTRLPRAISRSSTRCRAPRPPTAWRWGTTRTRPTPATRPWPSSGTARPGRC